jgi:hypothetical protein
MAEHQKQYHNVIEKMLKYRKRVFKREWKTSEILNMIEESRLAKRNTQIYNQTHLRKSAEYRKSISKTFSIICSVFSSISNNASGPPLMELEVIYILSIFKNR